MTNEVAIAHGKEQLEIFGGEHREFIALAIEALDKQIPKKPILKHDVGFIHRDYADGHADTIRTENGNWHCPICDSIVGHQVRVHDRIHNQLAKKYCEGCGQAIDWSEK